VGGLLDAMRAYLEGDATPFDAWNRCGHPALVQALRDAGHGVDRAEELAAFVECQAFHTARSHRPVESELAWIATVVRNCLHRDRRRAGRTIPLPSLSAAPDAEPVDTLGLRERVTRAEALRLRAIEAMKDPYRRALALQCLDGLTREEVLARLEDEFGVGREGGRRILRLAHRRLHAALRPDDE